MDLLKSSGAWIRGLAVLLTTIFLAGCASDDGSFKYDPLGSGAAPPPRMAAAPSADPAMPPPPHAAGTNNAGAILYPGDGVIVAIQDTPTPVAAIEALVERDGTITLMYNQVFQAAGKSSGQLAQEIRAAYVPRYFVNMTPVVSIKDRFYYVTGEVKSPGRQVYIGHMTVLDAIATAGGFTDFSRKGAVWLFRASDGKRETIDAVMALDHSELNLEVFPNDRVHVRKRWW